MTSLGKLLQLIGLVIPPLAMAAQLATPDEFSAGKMLQFLAAAVGCFSLGYLLRTYRGGS